VAHHQYDLCPRQLAGELHAAEDILVGDVARHPGVEAVSDAQVHDRLGRRSGIDAAQNDGGGILALRAHLLLLKIVVRRFLAAAKPLIAFSHHRYDVVRCEFVSLRFAQRGGEGKMANGTCAQKSHRGGYTGDSKEAPAVHVIAMWCRHGQLTNDL
jgi:hypothetical protein